LTLFEIYLVVFQKRGVLQQNQNYGLTPLIDFDGGIIPGKSEAL
jgi:hypothetical protein